MLVLSEFNNLLCFYVLVHHLTSWIGLIRLNSASLVCWRHETKIPCSWSCTAIVGTRIPGHLECVERIEVLHELISRLEDVSVGRDERMGGYIVVCVDQFVIVYAAG